MKVQRGRRGEQEKGECWEVLETAERGVRESKRDSVGWETFLSLCVSLFLFCVAWLCRARLPACLPAWHVYSPGGTVDLPERHQSQRTTTGDEAAHIAQPPAAPNQEARKKREKQLWSALSFSPLSSISTTLPPSFRPRLCSLYRETFSLSFHQQLVGLPFMKLLPTWCHRASCHCSNGASRSRRVHSTRKHTHNSDTLYSTCNMMHNKQITSPPEGRILFYFFYSTFKVNIREIHPISCHVIKK